MYVQISGRKAKDENFSMAIDGDTSGAELCGGCKGNWMNAEISRCGCGQNAGAKPPKPPTNGASAKLLTANKLASSNVDSAMARSG